MDIVDAQVHIKPGTIDQTLASMDALGISAALLDELWGFDSFQPRHLLANGTYRVTAPVAELACTLHPDRFAYVLRVARTDPEVAGIIRMVKAAPHARGIRITPGIGAEAEPFANGAYDALLEVAQDERLPTFVLIPGRVELMHRYLLRFPRLSFVVDHCGMHHGHTGVSPASYFDEVLKLAIHQNVALKWSHAQDGFDITEYPFASLWPHLRRAIRAFGPERVMWASDKTTVASSYSWADLLFCLRDCAEFTPSEKDWLLGRSIRTVLNWTPHHAPRGQHTLSAEAL